MYLITQEGYGILEKKIYHPVQQYNFNIHTKFHQNWLILSYWKLRTNTATDVKRVILRKSHLKLTKHETMQKSLKLKVKTWFYHLLLTIQSSCIACNSFWYMKSVKEAGF